MMMGMLVLGGLGFFIFQSWRQSQMAIVEAPPAAQQRPDNPPANLSWRGRNQLPEDVDVDIGI